MAEYNGRPVPSKEQRDEAYKKIMQIAEENALILQAFGGVTKIVHPDTQEEHGLTAKCLYMAGLGDFPAAENNILTGMVEK